MEKTIIQIDEEEYQNLHDKVIKLKEENFNLKTEVSRLKEQRKKLLGLAIRDDMEEEFDESF